MSIEKKIALIEDMMDLDEGTITADMDLADIEEWDSMAKLSLIVMLDDECGKVITADEIKKLVTVQDILDFMD